MYAFVGQPIKLYYLNMIAFNSLEGLNVQVDSSGRGVSYSDRWEYTPTQAETFVVSIAVRDSENNLLGEGNLTIEAKASTAKHCLAVLVVGDSTIAAGEETQIMLDLAADTGYDLKLLGTQGTATNVYEGRGGWSAGSYLRNTTSPFYNPNTASFDFAYYMATQGYESVDCVCIQLGINDVFAASSDETLTDSITSYLANMKCIIESIHAYDANIKIVWNMILPGSTDQSKFEAAYGDAQTAERYKRNTYLTNLEILKKADDMVNVYIAPTNSSLDVTNNMASGGGGAVHPAAAGYSEIGTLLYSLIRAIN